MAEVAMPTQRDHESFILAWLLAHPGPQGRKNVVNGAVALGPWTPEQRAVPWKNPTRFASKLYAQAYLRMWPMRDTEGLIQTAGRDAYSLTDLGRLSAQKQGLLLSGPLLKQVGIPFPEDRTLPDRQTAMPTVVFEYDPDERDRQTRQHEALVLRLAIAIRKLGHVPLLPTGDGPRYDLAFVKDDDKSLVVIEVKSLSDNHAVHQLRLGLGQVLHYAHALSADRQVSPALAVPTEPPVEWAGVCEAAGVQLIVAPGFTEPLAALAAGE
ncbi:MAG TPA: hypothetical protein VIJ51_05705 [Solirubrobacteraceae bacterium]